MKFTFQQRLSEELLLSERKRTVMLIIIFCFSIFFRLLNSTVIKFGEETILMTSFATVWLFPISILLFESFSFFYIDRRLRKRKLKIPLAAQYLNATFEIGLLTVIILLVAKQYPNYNVLKSPAVLIYFIFIVLSTLRLNFGLSCFCGLLACISYVTFCFHLYSRFYTDDFATAFILLMCGIASGMVARQIRAGINNSVKEAEKRQRVENLFGQQISAEVAEKMLENDGNIESKRMTVAIMFIDIRNFTLFVIGKKPEEIVQYQNAFFKIVINTVTRHNGIVNQFLGDGCMVTFGAPLNLKNPAEYAVKASVMLLEAIDRAIEKGELAATKIGIGIHTGEAVTGNIGTSERQQYSITGNVVILASRIEQLNKQFGSQLLVSEDVVRSMNMPHREITCFGSVPLKGWHKPISIYKLA